MALLNLPKNMKIKFLQMMMNPKTNQKTMLVVLLNCKYNCITCSNYTYYPIIDDYLIIYHYNLFFKF